MPSPIAHSVTGYAIARLFPQGHKANRWSNWRLFWLFYGPFVALAADSDFIPQLLTGEKYHHKFTHSIVFTLGFTLVVWILSYFLTNQLSIWFFLLTLTLYSSHLFLDFFTAGGTGIQLFWPIIDGQFRSVISIFPSTHHSEPLFHPGHFLFIIFEVAYATLLFGVIWLHNKRTSEHHLVNQEKSFTGPVEKSVFIEDIE